MNEGVPAPLRQDLSDEELLLRLAAGHQEALGLLYSRYASPIFHLAARSLDAGTAEELVQDVMLVVWRSAATFDPDRGPVRAWVMQVARFRIINELRRRNSRPQAEPDPDGIRLVNLQDPDPDPADMVWKAEHQDTIIAAMNELPPPQRQAVGLAVLGELTHQQVAAKLDLPLGTAKTRIRLGLQKLRVSLAPLVAAAVLAAGGLLAILGFRYHAEQGVRERDDRALALVTTSDTSVLRLVRGPAGGAATHGSYRGRPGATIAVLSVSHLGQAPAGRQYVAWVRDADHWTRLGMVYPDPHGSAILIAQGSFLADLPEIVQVTLERSGETSEPAGPVVAVWPESSGS